MTDQTLTPSQYEFVLGDERGPNYSGIPNDDFRNWFFVQVVPMSYSSVDRPDVYDRHQQVVSRTHTSLGVMWVRKKRPWRTLKKYDNEHRAFRCCLCEGWDSKGKTRNDSVLYMRTHPNGFAHIECGDAEDVRDGVES